MSKAFTVFFARRFNISYVFVILLHKWGVLMSKPKNKYIVVNVYKNDKSKDEVKKCVNEKISNLINR